MTIYGQSTCTGLPELLLRRTEHLLLAHLFFFNGIVLLARLCYTSNTPFKFPKIYGSDSVVDSGV